MLPVMDTGNRMSRASRRDYLQRIYPRYRKAGRAEKQGILDEFCANCSYHRKHAIRVLNRPLAAKPAPRRRPRGRTYSSATLAVLKSVWEAADYPWSVRLKALLPEWMPWIRRRFRLRAGTEQQLLRISPRSIDYRLGGEKRKLRRRLYGPHQAGDLAEASHPAQDGSLGRPGAGLHRDRPGVALGQLGFGRFLLLAQSDRHPHGLDRDPGRLGQEQRSRARLDPFELSASMEAKLRRIFALSREAPAPPSSAPRPQASAPAEAVPHTPAVARPALERLADRRSSSSASRKTARPCAVEMTRRGKRGKLQEPRRVFPPFPPRLGIRPKTKRPIPTFPQRRRLRVTFSNCKTIQPK